ncbi:hypothetical protein [Aneurinibacillus terranovensis]|uniref:hypothetical protein n=1 Tax=Aneurinibacillus terranovensis TaxID=278991 RepID=UPI000427DA45|nr:hypothetical protein [Aneurinibacillus terranovensis]
MCQVCGDTGVVQDERTYGVMVKPCYCEVAQRKQEQAVKEIQVMLEAMERIERDIA